MYADFESILGPMGLPQGAPGSHSDSIQGVGNDPTISSTRGIHNHVPSGWCVRSQFAYGKVENPLTLYRGKDCV